MRLKGAIRKGQVLINARDAIVDDHVGVFAHHAQDLTAGEGRANAIAIRPRVRGDYKTLPRANRL